MNNVSKKSFFQNVSNVLGVPNKRTFHYIWDVFCRYRFMVLLYFIILAVYAGTLYSHAERDPNNFWLSFSASMLEDMIMFIFLTVGVTFISIKLSNINPEDYEYERRIKALMNSSRVTGDKKAFGYVHETITELLTYNRKMYYKVNVLDYFPDENAYAITTERMHIITNMCKDRNFEKRESPIVVVPDVAIGPSYGMLNCIKRLDASDLRIEKETISDKVHLTEGENVFYFDSSLQKDAEEAFLISYSMFAKVYDLSDLKNAWHYTEAIRYTADIEFSIVNKLRNNQSIKFELRNKIKDSGAIIPIASGFELQPGDANIFRKKMDTSLLPGDRIEFYLHPQEKLEDQPAAHA